MKLEDIAKITIDEVAAELEKIQKLEDMQKAKAEEQVRKEPFSISEDEPKEQTVLSKQSITSLLYHSIIFSKKCNCVMLKILRLLVHEGL